MGRRTSEEVTAAILRECQNPTMMSQIALKARVNSTAFLARVRTGEVELVREEHKKQGARKKFPIKYYQATKKMSEITPIHGELKRIKKPVIEVYHNRLGLVTISSGNRECPFCDRGMLLVGRDLETFELQEYDNCLFCGQRVRYMDIEKLRKKETLGGKRI